MLNVQYGIAISMLLHASPVWMRHVEPMRRSGCSAGSCYYIAVVVVDVKISNLCCPAVCGSSCLFLQVPGMGLCTGWTEVVCEHPP